jgi:hypothetical protein
MIYIYHIHGMDYTGLHWIGLKCLCNVGKHRRDHIFNFFSLNLLSHLH